MANKLFSKVAFRESGRSLSIDISKNDIVVALPVNDTENPMIDREYFACGTFFKEFLWERCCHDHGRAVIVEVIDQTDLIEEVQRISRYKKDCILFLVGINVSYHQSNILGSFFKEIIHFLPDGMLKGTAHKSFTQIDDKRGFLYTRVLDFVFSGRFYIPLHKV